MTDAASPLPAFDPDFPRCRAHRSLPAGDPPSGCDACREAVRWVARRAGVAAARDLEARRGCVMCDAQGQRWDPGTHVAVSPLRSCDHTTEHAAVVAEIGEAESRAERAREALPARPPVPSTAGGRARARALFLTARRRVPVASGTDNSGLERDAAPADLEGAVAG